eukprot:gene43558-54104_t
MNGERLSNYFSPSVASLTLHSATCVAVTSLSDIRVVTTDNYQGEECDIVLLSLVRSNAEKKAGFVKIENRVCVALSRARNGMYIVGNFDMIRESSPLWDRVCELVDNRGQMGPALCLQCDNHPEQVNFVSEPEGFKCAPAVHRASGAWLLSSMHSEMLGSLQTMCCESQEGAQAMRPLSDGDVQRGGGGRAMHESLSHFHDLRVPKSFLLPCGHTLEAMCSTDITGYECKAKCSKKLAGCDHDCHNLCFQACEEVCMEMVKKIIPTCQSLRPHQVKAKCGVSLSATNLCRDKCSALLSDCNHMCQETCGTCLPPGVDHGAVKHGACTK